MKKALFFFTTLMLLCLSVAVNAQSLADYTVTTSTETYTSIADATLLLSSVTSDDGTQTVTLPFNFPFGENTYPAGTTLTVRADGYVYFGTSSPGHSSKTAWTNTTSEYYFIAPFLNYDGKITANGATSGAYCTTDNPDNPTMLIIEFKGLQCYNSPNGDYNFQLRLHSNGNISTVYGESTLSTYSSSYASASQNFFLNAKADKICLTGSYAEPVAGTPSALPNFTTAPVAGQVITFVRPVISCPKPTGLAAALTPGNGSIATLSWTKGGEETNWVVEYSTASDFTGATQVTSGFITTDAPSISVNLTGLTAEQTYYARVKANCGGGDESEWSNVIEFAPTDAYTITVYDGAGISGYIPMYGNYFDDFTKSEFIIPATELGDMQWGSIESITFYAKTVGTSNSEWYNTNQKVFVKEVNTTTLGGSYSGMDGATVVFNGLLDMPTTSTDGYTITFSQPYTYSGGNLLIGVYNDDDGSYNNVEWYGTSGLTSGVSAYGNNSTSLASVGYNAQTFLPKTTFNYTPGVAPSCLPPTDLVATEDQPNQSVLSWTANSNENAWTVYYKKTSEENYTSVVANSNPFTLPNLTAATNYIYYVVANCSTEDVSDPSQTKSFTTACPEFLDVPFTENFDSYTLNSTSAPSSRILPICWNYSNESTYSSNKWYPTMNYYSYTDYSNSSPNYLRFYVDAYSNSDHEPTDQYLILPAIQNLSSMRLKLYARANSTSTNYDATFKVGVMEGNDFVQVGNAITPTTTTYELYTIPFSSYAGSGTHIAIMVEAPETPTASYTYAYRSVFIDDITVEEIPNCLEPSDLHVVENGITTSSVQLEWTPAENTTAWDIYYTTDPSDVPTASTSPSVTGTTDNPCTVGSLTHSSHYYAYVRTHCANEQSPWTTSTEFDTKCEPFTISENVKYQEGFEDYTGTTYDANGVIPICWANSYSSTASVTPHVIGSGSYYYVHDGTKALTFYGSNYNYVSLPEFSNNLSDLQISFWMRCENSSYGTLTLGYITSEDNGTYNTFTPVPNVTIANSSSMVERGPYYLTNVPNEATRLVFRWYYSSQYSCCIDDIEVSLLPSCLPLSGNPMTTATTAHTATLNWNVTDNNQTQWQIAYKPGANFDPTDAAALESATIETANEKPYTISGLDQSQEYYAYVRAICGNDYSTWAGPVTFTTIAGYAAPTNLAVDNASITSSQATVTWNGVATNEYHDSYDLYYSTESTMPTELVATSLIEGIGETNKPLTGLEATTTYYVWVRDNCGNDGYSAWAGPINFTTKASCSEPENLVVTNVNAHGAMLDWTAGQGNDSYTLRYRKAITAPVNIDESYDFEDGTQQGWTTYDEDGDGYSWSVNNSSTHNNSSRCIYSRYNGNAVPNNWLISPEIALGGTLSFYAMRSSSGTGEKFQIFVSTTGTDISNFTAITEEINATSTYEFYEYDLSAYSGNGYVAIKHTAAKDQYFLYVDDIHITATIPGVYDEWQTVNNATKPYPFSDLDAETYYEAQVNGYCNSSSTTTDWSDPISFTTTIACPAPTSLGYAVPETDHVVLNWRETANANEWQICLNGDLDNLRTVTMSEISSMSYPGVPGADIYNYTLNNLTPGTAYTAKVRANCGNGDGVSEWSNEINFTTLETCGAPTAFTLGTVTAHEASFSWTAGNGNTAWKIYVKKHADAEYPATYTDANIVGATINELDDATTYDVKIVPNCDDTKSLEVENAFTTECDAITITDVYNYEQNFNTPVVTSTYNSTTGLVVPSCWENPYTTGSSQAGQPHIIAAPSGNYSYNYSTDQVLNFYGSGNNYVTLPEFTNDLSDLQISFKWATEGSSSSRVLTLGYITAADDGHYSSFTAIGNGYSTTSTSAESYHALKTETAYLNNVPAEATRLVFRWYSSDQYSCNIDDVVVSLAPSCYPVGTLAEATNITATSADLSWTLVDNNQESWRITYATNEGFTENMHAIEVTTHENYTLSGLTPETHYYVAVCATCGAIGDGAGSNVIEFTTPVACDAPTALTLDSRTTTSLTVSWTENGDATSWIVGYKAEGEEDFHDNMNVTENPYTIEGLTDETNYTVRVKSNCSNGYPSPELTGQFQTEASCPAPTGLYTASVTSDGATVRWAAGGDETAWNVQYHAQGENGWTTGSTQGDSTYTFSQLTPNTTYEWQVQAVCSDNNISDWSVSGFFTTLEQTPAEVCKEWVLLTDAGNLTAGDQIIIAAANDNLAMSTTQNTNNRNITAIVKTDNGNKMEEPSNEVQILTLETGIETNTWALNTGSGYLYAASSSSNQLKTKDDVDANASWTITVANGDFTIKAEGSNTRNLMRYNSSNSLISCYGSGQDPLVIYKLADKKATSDTTAVVLADSFEWRGITCPASGDYEVVVGTAANGCDSVRVLHLTLQHKVATPVINPVADTYTEPVNVTITCETEGATIYYTTDGTEPNTQSTAYATEGFTLNETATVKAIAVKAGDEWVNSDVATVNYTINIPFYTVSFDAGNGTTTAEPMQGNVSSPINLSNVTATPSDPCVAQGWSFAGWSTEAIQQPTTEPTLVSNSFVPTQTTTLYAVYSKTEETAFDNTTAGEYAIYAAVGGTNHYATGTVTGNKLSSTTDASEATLYTFEKPAGYGNGEFAIKVGNSYIKYNNSGTNLGTASDPYKWTISEGTNGTWRISSQTSDRALIFRAGSTNQFGGYSTSNISSTGTEYFDIEIGGSASTTTYNSTPACISSYDISATSADETQGTVSGMVGAEVFANGTYNEGTEITLTATANEGYTFVNWTKGGEAVYYDANYTFTVTEDASFVANFSVNSYNITANVAPANSGSVEGAGSYTYGSTATLTATAATGYHFVNWTEGGQEVSTEATYGFTVTSARELVANFTANEYTITYMDGEEQFTTQTYFYNATVAAPQDNPTKTGYTFAGWDPALPATMPAQDITVSAQWNINTYNLTVTQATGGTISVTVDNNDPVTASTTANYNAQVALTAMPAANYLFSNWVVTSGETTIAVENNQFNMPAGDVTVTAVFTPMDVVATPTFTPVAGTYNDAQQITINCTTGGASIYYTLDGTEPGTSSTLYDGAIAITETATLKAIAVKQGMVNSNVATALYRIVPKYNVVIADNIVNGTVTAQPTSDTTGATITLTAEPATGYHFDSWHVTSGNEVIAVNNNQFIMPAGNVTVNATFEPNSYNVTLNTNNGTINSGDIDTYTYGVGATLPTDVTLTGNTFGGWYDNAGFNGDPVTTISTTETGDKEFWAKWTINSYTIAATANPTAGGSVEGAGTYDHGTNVTMIATANDGYAFVNWTENGVQVSTDASYTFTFTEGRTLVANFTPIIYTVTFNPGTGTCQTASRTGSIESSINIDDVTAVPPTLCVDQDWVFAGWSTASVAETDQAPAFVSGTEYIPTDNITLYAVYTKTEQGEGTWANATSIEVGDRLALVCSTANRELSGISTTSTKYGTVEPYTGSPAGVYPLTVVEGFNTDYPYAFKTSDNTYLSWSSGSSLTTRSNIINESSWNVTFVSGNATISNAKDNSRKLQYNSSSPRFACYSSGQTAVQLYKYTASSMTVYNTNPVCYVYAVNVDQNIEHGSVVADSTTDIVAGTEITLTPTPATGYHFGSWIVTAGNDPVTVENNKFTMPESNVNVSALFWIDTLTVNVNANPAVGGTVSGAGDYEYGDMVTLNATANTGYTFVNWTENNQEVSTDATYEFTFNGAAGTRTFVANFSLNSYEITVSANPTEGGNVNGGNTYNHGATANLTATPSTGYHFVNWTKDNVQVSTDAEYSFTVAGAGAYVANFELNSYTIAATANPTAGGAVSGAGTYNHFENVTLTATVSNGYDFIGWYRGNDQVATSLEYSFEATEDVTLEARFAPRYTITFVPGSHSTSTIEPLQGSSVDPINIDEVTADPSALCVAQDWEFAGWSAAFVDETIQAPAFVSGTEYVPTNDITLYAVYKKTEGAGSNTASIDFSDQGYTNAQAISDVAISNNVNVTFALGTNSYNNAPKYYSNSVQIPAIRCYGGNTFTVTATDAAITNITLTFGSEDGSNYISPDNGDYSNGTWTGNENSVIFTINGTSGQRRIAGMSVTTFNGTVIYNSDPECFVYDVVVNPDIEHGTVTADPNTGVIAGTEITLTNTPSEGYHFAGWTVTAGNDPVTVENNKFLMPESDVNVSATFEPDTFTLTINYILEGGGTASETYSARLPYGTQYSVSTPVISGLTPSQELVSGTIPANDVTVDVTYYTDVYTLTVHYVYADNTQAATDEVRNLAYNVGYTVPSPIIVGYTPDQDTVRGIMGEANVEVTVVYNINSHNLTINYVNEDATAQVADSYTTTLNYNDNYSVVSPQVAGYAANKSVVTGTLGDADMTETVTYYLVQTSIADATNCSGTGTGSLTVTAPVGNFEYSLDGVTFQSETQFANLNAGDYTLYIRPTGEAYNYSGVWTVNSNITMPVAVASANPFYCLGNEINLSGNGSSTGSEYTYAWSGPNNFTATDINAMIATAGDAHSGTYTLAVTNTVTNCVSEAPVDVIVNTPNMNGYEFTITTNGDAYANLVNGEAAPVFAAPTVQHYLDGANVNYTVMNDAATVYDAVGDYTITWTATDQCGNIATTTQVLHIILGSCPVAADIDGNTYPTVALAGKCWMAKNLRTTRFSDGRAVNNLMVYNNIMYPNTTENLNRYGYLYDWDNAMDAQNGTVTPDVNNHVQGICPTGWHLPTNSDFMDIAGPGSATDMYDLRYNQYWLDGGGNNSTNYSLLPGGCYNDNTGRYENLLGNAYLWGVNPASPSQPRVYWADCKCYMWQVNDTTNGMGYSVRCIKD